MLRDAHCFPGAGVVVAEDGSTARLETPCVASYRGGLVFMTSPSVELHRGAGGSFETPYPELRIATDGQDVVAVVEQPEGTRRLRLPCDSARRCELPDFSDLEPLPLAVPVSVLLDDSFDYGLPFLPRCLLSGAVMIEEPYPPSRVYLGRECAESFSDEESESWEGRRLVLPLDAERRAALPYPGAFLEVRQGGVVLTLREDDLDKEVLLPRAGFRIWSFEGVLSTLGAEQSWMLDTTPKASYCSAEGEP